MRPNQRPSFIFKTPADDLAESVIVERQKSKLAFNLLAHVFGPGFPTEVGVFEPQPAGGDALASGDLGDVQSVTRRAHKHLRLKIANEHDLSRSCPMTVPRRAYFFDAVMQPESAGKQP